MNKNTIELPIMGVVKLEETDWEYRFCYHIRAYQFENTPIDIDVNFQTITKEKVKQVSIALERFKAIVELGFDGIIENFKQKGEAKYYVTEWRDDIFVQIFNKKEFQVFMSDTNSKLNIDDRLLSKLKIVRFGIYAESETSFINLDYAFGYEMEDGFRDNLLVVKLDKKFKIIDISTEG